MDPGNNNYIQLLFDYLIPFFLFNLVGRRERGPYTIFIDAARSVVALDEEAHARCSGKTDLTKGLGNATKENIQTMQVNILQ